MNHTHKRANYCVSCYQKHKAEIHNKNGDWKDSNQPNAKIITIRLNRKDILCDWCKKPCEARHP